MFKGNYKEYAIVSVSDITQLKKFEKVSDRFKNLYLRSMAHDLRTPLNTIININEHLMVTYKNEKMI